MLTCIIHKSRQQAKLVVQGPQSIFQLYLWKPTAAKYIFVRCMKCNERFSSQSGSRILQIVQAPPPKRCHQHMWCDQAKSVWSRSNLVFIVLTNCMHHFYSYILQKTPLKLVNWFQRYEQLKDAKNSRKQKIVSALFGSILKSIFPTSDWFCLITSHIHISNARSCYVWSEVL